MNAMKFAALLAGAAISALAAPAVFADTAAPAAGAYKAPMNAYGQPDLEGTWTNATLTALERPAQYGGRSVLTEEEVTKIEGGERQLIAGDSKPTDPKVKTTDLPYSCGLGFTGA